MQIENPKNMEPDLRFSMQIRQSHRAKPAKKYDPYGYYFVVDSIDLKKVVEGLVGLEEITVSQEVDIVDDQDKEWIDNRSKSEVEFDSRSLRNKNWGTCAS